MELKRLFEVPDPVEAIAQMRETGLLAAVLPEAGPSDTLRRLVAIGAPSDPLPSPPPLTGEIEQRLRPTIIFGSVDEVAEQIGAYRRALGDETLFICRSYFPGLAYGLQRRTIELLGERVLPDLS